MVRRVSGRTTGERVRLRRSGHERSRNGCLTCKYDIFRGTAFPIGLLTFPKAPSRQV
jgi:hypothetical protein